VGVFYQYDLIAASKHEFYPEISINYGNYCTCGDLDPFKLDGIVYIGYGAGWDFHIYKNFYLDTGFMWYSPINAKKKLPPDTYVYSMSQYILGISYRFSNEK